MIAPTRDPLDEAEAWLERHGFSVTADMGLEELVILIDFAVAASEATGAGHSRASIEAVLTAAFDDFPE